MKRPPSASVPAQLGAAGVRNLSCGAVFLKKAMRTSFSLVMIVGTALLGGCASPRQAAPVVKSSVEARSSRRIGYDDRQVARIERGETTEAQLLEWFGAPVRRELKPDGQRFLEWSFSAGAGEGTSAGGKLSVSLTPDGKVEAYSARRSPSLQVQTVEFVERSDADLREHLANWAHEGWSVLSVSGRLPQPDGTVHRKVELSRREGGSTENVDYDDRQIARIQRRETTESQLLEWFGSPDSRDLRADGRTLLAWSFRGRTAGVAGRSGGLNVDLAPDGKVDAYSARRAGD